MQRIINCVVDNSYYNITVTRHKCVVCSNDLWFIKIPLCYKPVCAIWNKDTFTRKVCFSIMTNGRSSCEVLFLCRDISHMQEDYTMRCWLREGHKMIALSTKINSFWLSKYTLWHFSSSKISRSSDFCSSN